MQLARIIGITGTNGSGKDTLGAILAQVNYRTVSLSDILRAEATKRRLPHTRENLSAISNELRTAHGDDILPKRIIEESPQDEKLVITSIRTPGEVTVIQTYGGIVAWVDADQRTRYERIKAAQRGRVDDEVTFEEFQHQEAAEMTPTKQGGNLNMSGARDLADITIRNDFPSKEAFEAHLRELFGLN